jgi:hypothetical protein
MTYEPLPPLRNRHVMTVAAHFARRQTGPRVRRERWELPDGDFLDVDRLAGPTPDAPLVVIGHGLAGSSRSGYVRHLLAELAARGLGAVALNWRGCSGEPNRLLRAYHSGETGDLAWAVDRLVAERPGRRLGLAGISLGGNVTAKYLGERGDALPAELVAAAVVSVPFDLKQCALALDGPGLWPQVYREWFLLRLRQTARIKAQRFPGAFPLERVLRARTLHAFDDLVTGPIHGFAGADDYYRRASAFPLIGAVRRPLLVVASADDPFIPEVALPVAAARANPQVTFEVHRAGGHVGFLAGSLRAPVFWAERRVAAFLAERLG